MRRVSLNKNFFSKTSLQKGQNKNESNSKQTKEEKQNIFSIHRRSSKPNEEGKVLKSIPDIPKPK